MSQAVEFVTFNLKEGVSMQDFLHASEKMNRVFLSAQKGYISRKLLVDGETWADLVLWETMNDALNAAKSNDVDAYSDALEYFSFIQNADMHHFSVEKSY